MILERVFERFAGDGAPHRSVDATIDEIIAVTNFATVDEFAEAGRKPEDIERLIQRLVARSVGTSPGL
jgi:hypothetical protein